MILEKQDLIVHDENSGVYLKYNGSHLCFLNIPFGVVWAWVVSKTRGKAETRRLFSVLQARVAGGLGTEAIVEKKADRLRYIQ